MKTLLHYLLIILIITTANTTFAVPRVNGSIPAQLSITANSRPFSVTFNGSALKLINRVTVTQNRRPVRGVQAKLIQPLENKLTVQLIVAKQTRPGAYQINLYQRKTLVYSKPVIITSAASKQVKTSPKQSTSVRSKTDLLQKQADAKRKAELARKQADAKRKAELARKQAEDKRKAELARKQAEDKRKAELANKQVKENRNTKQNDKQIANTTNQYQTKGPADPSQMKKAGTGPQQQKVSARQSANNQTPSGKSGKGAVSNKMESIDAAASNGGTLSTVLGIMYDTVSNSSPETINKGLTSATLGAITFAIGVVPNIIDPNNTTVADNVTANLISIGITALTAGAQITASGLIAAAGVGFGAYQITRDVQRATGVEGVIGEKLADKFSGDPEVDRQFEQAKRNAARRRLAEAARRKTGGQVASGDADPAPPQQNTQSSTQQAQQSADAPATERPANDIPRVTTPTGQHQSSAKGSGGANSTGANRSTTNSAGTARTSSQTGSNTTDTTSTSQATAGGVGPSTANQSRNSEEGVATVTHSQTNPDGSYTYKWRVLTESGREFSGTTTCSGGTCTDTIDGSNEQRSYKDTKESAPDAGARKVIRVAKADSNTDENSTQDDESGNENQSEENKQEEENKDSEKECAEGDANCTSESEESDSEDEKSTEEEAPATEDSTPNPNANDGNGAANDLKLYERSGGRVGGDTVRNQQRNIDMNRSGGITDPAENTSESGYSEHDSRNIEGKKGGHVDGNPEDEPPAEASQHQIRDIMIRRGGGHTDPVDNGVQGGTAPAGPNSPKNPAGSPAPVVGGGTASENDGADGDDSGADIVGNTQSAPATGVKQQNRSNELNNQQIQQNLKNRLKTGTTR